MYRLEVKINSVPRYYGMATFRYDANDLVLNLTEEQTDMLGWLNDTLGYPAGNKLRIPMFAAKWRLEEGYGNIVWMDGLALYEGERPDHKWYGQWLEVDEETAIQLKLMYPTLFYRIIAKPEPPR
jgi:hypothetical protein